MISLTTVQEAERKRVLSAVQRDIDHTQTIIDEVEQIERDLAAADLPPLEDVGLAKAREDLRRLRLAEAHLLFLGPKRR